MGTDPQREGFQKHYDRNGWSWEWKDGLPYHVRDDGGQAHDMAGAWRAWQAAAAAEREAADEVWLRVLCDHLNNDPLLVELHEKVIRSRAAGGEETT